MRSLLLFAILFILATQSMMSQDIPDEKLQEMIHRAVKERGMQEYISLHEKEKLGKELFNSFRKLDVLQELLEDEEITEIMINGTQNIFIEREGKLLELERRFLSRRKLEDVVQQIVSGANRIVNEASPIVDARLEDGSRVNIVLYPIALNGPIVTIRKFPKSPMTMQELIRLEALDEEIADFLEMLMIAEYNLFVSGGTGSG